MTWMSKKMNCPECRAKINSHVANKVLDSYIEKFVENFVPKKSQEARKALLEERKKKMEARTNEQRGHSSSQQRRRNTGEFNRYSGRCLGRSYLYIVY